MIRIFLVLFIIFTNTAYNSSYAGFLGGLSECITNPCECNCTSVKEVWQTTGAQSAGDPSQTEEKYYGDPGCNCPPYNKFNMSLGPSGGSKTSRRSGCLKGGSKPGLFSLYDYSCAEALKENYQYDYNSHFNPKIKVRNQSCFGGCWFEDKSLKYDGQCQYFASSSLIFPVRLCARVAYPSYDGEPSDAGYTAGRHLTKKGYISLDPDVEFTEYNEVNGVEVETIDRRPIVAPKICAYKDPDLFITFLRHGLSGAGVAIATIVNSIRNGEITAPEIDFLDWNPTSQPLHKTEHGSPIVSLLIFIFEQGLNLAEMLEGLIGDLFGEMGMGFMVKVIEFIGGAVEFIGEDVIVNILQQINSLNRIVDESLGCVAIPMGPLPPPYCPTISKNYRPVEMHPICRTGHDGVIEYPTLNFPCQVSSVENKYLRPSIRATFDYYVQECASGAPLSDACVTFTNILAPDQMHNLYGKLDFIPKCGNSVTSGCVNTTFPASTTWTYGGQIYSGYRLIYGYRSDGLINLPVESYIYQDDAGTAYPHCSSPTTSNCLFLYGINSGQYHDLNMQFPATESTYNNQDLVATHSFSVGVGVNANTVNVAAKVIRVSDDSKEQEKGEVCLYDVSDNDRVVDCQDRISVPKPVVYACDSPSANISCNATHFNPKMIASVESDGLSSQGVVEPATLTSEESVTVNLGGYDYDSFVTDNDFKTIPYDTATDTHAYSANSRYGEYVGNISLFHGDGSFNNSAIYLRGLEYDFGRYVVGGQKICLTGYEYERCTPIANKNCVLTNKVNDSSSKLLSDRIEPSASIGLFLTDSQYFANTGANFDQSTQSIRDKTAIEMNLCIDIPEPPKCSAIEESDAVNHGNATWPESSPSEAVIGTCLNDHTSGGADGPTRACYLNKNSSLSSYQAVDSGTECSSGFPLDPSLRWQKINIAMLNSETLNIKVQGEVSLCRAYIPSNNLQQSSANDNSGNPVPIPRMEEEGAGVAMKLNPRDGGWKNITDLYQGDKFSVIIGPDRVCNNSSCLNMNYYNIMTKSNEIVNCPTGQTDYHPYCGAVSVSNNNIYGSHWNRGGDGTWHAMSNGSSIPNIPLANVNSSYDNLYSGVPDLYDYYMDYQNLNMQYDATYQIKYHDNHYTDNHGGYTIYTKHTKCIREKGQSRDDPGFNDRGRLQVYFASNGEDPNATNPTSGITDLNVTADGLTSYISPGDGYMWIRVKNQESDYEDSAGLYNLQLEKIAAPAMCPAEGSNPSWPELSAGDVVRGDCGLDYGPVLPYRKCGLDGIYGPLEQGIGCSAASLYNITSDTDYFNASSGALLTGNDDNISANLGRNNPTIDNIYEYNIYFIITGSIDGLEILSMNNISFVGDNIEISLNGTEIFNNQTTNLSGWSQIGNAFYSNGVENSNIKQYAIQGTNTINVKVINGGVENLVYALTSINLDFRYVFNLDLDFGSGFGSGGGGK